MKETKLKGQGVLKNNKPVFVEYREVLFIAWKIGYRNHYIEKRLVPYLNQNPYEANISPIFFKSVLYASNYTAILHLCNIFEKRRRYDPKKKSQYESKRKSHYKSNIITIHKYLNYVDANKNLFKKVDPEQIESSIKDDKEKIEKKEKTIEKLLRLRDNLLAHLDKKAIKDLGKFFKDIDLKEPFELDDLYSLAREIIGRYSLYYDGKKLPWESESMLEADLQGLISLLRVKKMDESTGSQKP